jgi:hypothetical protein
MAYKEKSMLRQFIIIASLLFAANLAVAGEAGRIVFVAGEAQVAGRPVTLGDAVQEGDDLVTGADGYVYLKTVDNGFLILRPGSRARIVAYHIDTQNPANTRVKLELQQGVARTISGQGVKQARENFRFNTPVAAIGVRGTDFTVFTDQETSRVAVLSGGVVVSGFGGGCGPEGMGPCEGGGSRELFANQAGQLLQIQRGQATPQFLLNSGLSPDAANPPRKDEPTGKTSSVGATPRVATDYTLDPQKSEGLLAGAKLPSPQAPVPPPAAAPPSPPEVLWGRWQAVANLDADSEALAKLRSGEYVAATIANSYFISRVKNSELVLPRDGRVAFGLVNSEAWIQAAGRAPVAAAIHDSRLEVDFASRGFSTSMNVVAPGAQVGVYANGDVTLKGELVSDLMRSNAVVRGYLGGAEAKEAAYIFSTTGSDITAFGATRWAR